MLCRSSVDHRLWIMQNTQIVRNFEKVVDVVSSDGTCWLGSSHILGAIKL
jgi:hypothetical protein